MAPLWTIEAAWRASRTRGNNFDAIRLAAAAAVIVSHSFFITTGRHEREFIPPLADGTGLGEIAVYVFFAVSGFLITKSWLSNPRPAAFFIKRALRIYPALAFSVLALAFLVGPAITNRSLTDYFGSPETWTFLLNLGFMSQYGELPGVFDGQPVPGRVNLPLWTLGFEAACYAALALFGVLRWLSWKALSGAVLALFLLQSIGGLREFGAAGDTLFKLTLLAPHFFAGAALALLADRIPLTPGMAAGAAAALVAAGIFGGFVVAFSIFGVYLVIAAAFAPLGPVRLAGRFGDFSYGLYLWGWPAQQIVEAHAKPASWVGNVALALPLALLFAVVSWSLVERPALDLKRSLNFRKRERLSPKPLPLRAEGAIKIQNHD